MNGKFFISLGVLSTALMINIAIPADAHNGQCGNSQGNRGNHRGWSQGRGNAWGRQARFGNTPYNNTAYSNPYNSYNYNPNRFNTYGGYSPYNTSAYGNYNPNLFNVTPLSNEAAKLALKGQRIQQQLAAGNLSPDQAASLQKKLIDIQARMSTLNSDATQRFASEQLRLQQLLNSGTLNNYQTQLVQNQLASLQSQQNSWLGSTNFLGNGNLSGTLSSLRGILGF